MMLGKDMHYIKVWGCVNYILKFFLIIYLMRNQFPSNSRELPVFPAVLGNMSISCLFDNLDLEKWTQKYQKYF